MGLFMDPKFMDPKFRGSKFTGSKFMAPKTPAGRSGRSLTLRPAITQQSPARHRHAAIGIRGSFRPRRGAPGKRFPEHFGRQGFAVLLKVLLQGLTRSEALAQESRCHRSLGAHAARWSA